MTNEERTNLLREFSSVPIEALVTARVHAAVRLRCVESLRIERTKGTGVPYIRDGRSVRYRKADILAFIENAQASTVTVRHRAPLGLLTD